MKLSFISDTHSRHKNLIIDPGDVLIHCGDFTAQGSLDDTLDFAEYMAAQDFTHKVVIAGNHDWCFEDDRRAAAEACLREHDIVYLNDSAIEIDGLKFWGSPVQPEFYHWAFNRQRGEEIRAHWNLIPEDTDVLITHGPAFGILDICADGSRVGCEDLLQTIRRLKPEIHAFGHIHESYGIRERDGTIFVNACILDEHYRLKNAAIVVETRGRP